MSRASDQVTSTSELASARARVERLTERERECLRLVATGRSSKKIGRVLGISPASVDTHIVRARTKLGVRDRRAAADLVMKADADDATALDAAGGRGLASEPLSFGLPPLATQTAWDRARLVILGMTAITAAGAAVAITLALL